MGVTYEHLENVLESVYLGQCYVRQNDISALTATREYLGITGLLDRDTDRDTGTDTDRDTEPKQDISIIIPQDPLLLTDTVISRADRNTRSTCDRCEETQAGYT